MPDRGREESILREPQVKAKARNCPKKTELGFFVPSAALGLFLFFFSSCNLNPAPAHAKYAKYYVIKNGH